jgi:2-polyprenyl-3-methyl-5-hydroxy-6-metoxy-1,4-benzoquinol methylase
VSTNQNMTCANYYGADRAELIPLIPNSAKRVLDVGCGEGGFGLLLKTQRPSCEVWGIELIDTVGEIAAKRLDRVLIGDAERCISSLEQSSFDCIVFADVLEHLQDPQKILEIARPVLSPRGVVVTSIPNVRYIRVLFDYLVKKDWNYQDHGVLDRTHVKFFTKKSIVRMFDETGYQILYLEGLNPSKSLLFSMGNLLTLGFIGDSRYMHFVTVAKPC